MKRFLLILCIITIPLITFANDTESDNITNNDIHLELNQPQKTINLTRPDYKSQQNYDNNIQPNKNQDILNQNPNTKQTVKLNKKKKYKNTSIGTENTYTSTPDSCKSSGSVYTEYEYKKSKINTSYTKNTTPNQQTQDKGTLSVTPEYKLNEHVSVQNKYSTDLNNNSQKNEVKLNVKPFKDDRMDIGAGAGQKYSNTGTSSQVNFSTNIRW